MIKDVKNGLVDAIEDVMYEICGECKSGYCVECGLSGTKFPENLADTIISSLESERNRMEGVKNA